MRYKIKQTFKRASNDQSKFHLLRSTCFSIDGVLERAKLTLMTVFFCFSSEITVSHVCVVDLTSLLLLLALGFCDLLLIRPLAMLFLF